MRRVIAAIAGALAVGAVVTLATLLIVRGAARAAEDEDSTDRDPPTCAECVTDSECEGACAPVRAED